MTSNSKTSGRGSGTAGANSETALAMLQAIELQAALQTMLIEGYEWSFKNCTREGSGPQLSQKEARCIQSGIAAMIDARTYMAHTLNQQQK